MDSTGHRQVEAVNQEVQDCLQRIVSLLPGIVYQFRLRPDGSSCIPYASEVIRDIYRLSPEEVREDASRVFTYIHPDDLENFMTSIHTSARDMALCCHEFRVKFDDGTTRWILCNALPQQEADGSILWHGIVTDITERKFTEEALREREEVFRRLFEDINDSIFLIKNGIIVDCNAAALKLFGYSTKLELINRSPSDVSPACQPDGRSSVEKSAETIAIALRENYHRFEWTIATANGSTIPVDVTLTPITLGGEVLVHALFRDAAERKRAEASIRAEQKTRASRAAVRKLVTHMERLREQERKRVAREVHDELGQVLSVLRMDIALLKDRTGINNAAMDGIERNMLALVDRAIQGVRNVASSLRPVQLDMGIIAAIEWQCTEFTEHSGIPCSLKVAGDAIDLGEHRALALFRIVQESLTNIARHAGATRVEIIVASRNGAIEVEIRDNGKGFDPEGPVGNESFGLLGMHERAISIGGELNVTSRPGQGAVITLRISDNPAEKEELPHLDRRYEYRRVRHHC